MRFHLGIGSKAKRLFIPSPVKKQPLIGGGNADAGLDLKSQPPGFGFDFNSPGLGSKDETFFDSQPLFDSDCEDDFYSVNGDFTPSRGSTPNYKTSAPATPRLNEALLAKFSDSKSEISPTSRKKLSDLLHETLLVEQAGDDRNAADATKIEIDRKPDVYVLKTSRPPKSVDGTPYWSGGSSVCSGELTPNRGDSRDKERTQKAMGCCFPNLVKSFSFDDRQKLSPAQCST